jgi:hypothetical protein
MRWARVASCLADVTQQIHSFRASGVRLFQAVFVASDESTAFFRSAGILCTGPGLIAFVAICAG